MESWLLIGLVFIACPVGMGLMMWFMNKRMGGHSTGQASMHENAVSPEERLALLESEKQALERQIAAANRDGRTEGDVPVR